MLGCAPPSWSDSSKAEKCTPLLEVEYVRCVCPRPYGPGLTLKSMGVHHRPRKPSKLNTFRWDRCSRACFLVQEGHGALKWVMCMVEDQSWCVALNDLIAHVGHGTQAEAWNDVPTNGWCSWAESVASSTPSIYCHLLSLREHPALSLPTYLKLI